MRIDEALSCYMPINSDDVKHFKTAYGINGMTLMAKIRHGWDKLQRVAMMASLCAVTLTKHCLLAPLPLTPLLRRHIRIR